MKMCLIGRFLLVILYFFKNDLLNINQMFPGGFSKILWWFGPNFNPKGWLGICRIFIIRGWKIDSDLPWAIFLLFVFYRLNFSVLLNIYLLRIKLIINNLLFLTWILDDIRCRKWGSNPFERNLRNMIVKCKNFELGLIMLSHAI